MVMKVADSDSYSNSCRSCCRDDSSVVVSSCYNGGNDRNTIESLSQFICLSILASISTF